MLLEGPMSPVLNAVSLLLKDDTYCILQEGIRGEKQEIGH